MKNNSIREALPRLAKYMILCMILLILPANIGFQMYIHHENQKASANEMFRQVGLLIETNENDMREVKKDFSERCIRAADMAAYFVQYNPEVKDSLERTRELAKKLDVDELHYFSREGKICGGTHPEYYGLSFDSGEQMSFFLPMLQDPSLKLCQDITPNTGEGKQMQYAAVWMADGSGIIQIGMEPRRVFEEMEKKSLSGMIANMPSVNYGDFLIIDAQSETIVAATADELIGRDVSEALDKIKSGKNLSVYHYRFGGKKYCVYVRAYGDYILARTFRSRYMMKNFVVSSVLVLIYVLAVGSSMIAAIIWYVNKRLSDNIDSVVQELEKIEEGNLENLTIQTDIQEFDELIARINQLMKSLRLSWDRFSTVIDKGRFPIGIYEENYSYKRVFFSERLIEILGISSEDTGQEKALEDRIRSILKEISRHEADAENAIFQYDRSGETMYLRMEITEDDQSVTYYVTDATAWWKEMNQLKEENARDSLTGLLNRKGFHDGLGSLFTCQEQLKHAAMIMLDADGLKLVNDIYRHHIGDDYLKRIASALDERTRGRKLSARLGGDEFILFLYGYSAKIDLEQDIEKLRERRGERFLGESENVPVTLEFSMGYAFYPDDDRDYHVLMHLADQNMYEEKRKRKKWRRA